MQLRPCLHVLSGYYENVLCVRQRAPPLARLGFRDWLAVLARRLCGHLCIACLKARKARLCRRQGPLVSTHCRFSRAPIALIWSIPRSRSKCTIAALATKPDSRLRLQALAHCLRCGAPRLAILAPAARRLGLRYFRPLSLSRLVFAARPSALTPGRWAVSRTLGLFLLWGHQPVFGPRAHQ
jgi:hypothetical protein